MKNITEIYFGICKEIESTLEQKIERRLTLAERNAVRNAGSHQMLEAFSRSVDTAKNKEQAEYQLKDILQVNRLKDFLEMFLRKMGEKNIQISYGLQDIILAKGNCYDIMNFWDILEKLDLNQNNLSHIQQKFETELKKRK